MVPQRYHTPGPVFDTHSYAAVGLSPPHTVRIHLQPWRSFVKLMAPVYRTLVLRLNIHC